MWLSRVRRTASRPLCAFCCATVLLLLASGCGEIILPLGDFALTVTPISATTQAGTAAAPFLLTVTPTPDFASPLTISVAAPAGFTCAPASCSVSIAPASTPTTASIQLTPSLVVAPGAFPLRFTAKAGSLTHIATATVNVTAAVTVMPTTTPDFTLAVTPAASSVPAGASLPALTFTVTPANGFSAPVTVSTNPPAGFSCLPTGCSAALSSYQVTNAVQLGTSTATAPDVYTLTFTATSGSLSHTASVIITVSPQAGPNIVCAVPQTGPAPSNSRTGYVYTGDPDPYVGLIYEPSHNRIFVRNLQLNEVDVISPETLDIVARIPVPQPVGLDLSADGKFLIIGTQTHYFYRASTDTLCLTDRHYISPLAPFTSNLSPMFPTALADGSILFNAHDVASTASGLVVWTAATGFKLVSASGFLGSSVRNIVPSGDRMHAYIGEDDSGGGYARYDVGGAITINTVAFGSQPKVLAVNHDGSRVLVLNDCCGVVLTDSNFNTQANTSVAWNEGAAAEPDFSRFYFLGNQNNYIAVTDATLKPIGALAANIPMSIPSTLALAGWDGSRRLLSLGADGVHLISTANLNPIPTGSTPGFSTSNSMYGAATPPYPQNGFATTLNGKFTAVSSIDFSEGLTSKRATVLATASNAMNVTAPVFSTGCADILATFTSGWTAFSPQAFCYSPFIPVVEGGSGPTTGGSTLKLYGIGFGPTAPTVTIGGVQSNNVTLSQLYGSNGLIAYSNITALAPPGVSGDANITVSTSFGSTTLPRAFHYYQRLDTALPAGAAPQELLFDSARNRVLVTDAANSNLLVYSGSGALLQTVPTGPTPQGISLTPDGSRLLLLTAGDYKLTVLDASTYSVVQQATLPTSANSIFGPEPAGPGLQVAAMAGNTAYILTKAGYLQGPSHSYSPTFVYDYDLIANSLVTDPLRSTPYNITGGGSAFYMAASADGSTALISGAVSYKVGGVLTGPDSSEAGYSDAALTSDAHTLAYGQSLFDNGNHWQGNTAASEFQQTGIAFLGEGFLYGQQFNSSGSLLYRSTPAHIRVYDVAHGTLVRTLEIPGGLYPSTLPVYPTRLLAVDPAGQRLFTVTTAGLSILTFNSDPLSIAQTTLNGTQLAVSGSGFDSSSSVLIDTLSVPLAVVDANHLTVSVPTLPSGVHSVTVFNSNGDQYKLQLAFTTP